MADMPWREAILTTLQDSGTPMHYAEIAQARIQSRECEQFFDSAGEMFRIAKFGSVT